MCNIPASYGTCSTVLTLCASRRYSVFCSASPGASCPTRRDASTFSRRKLCRPCAWQSSTLCLKSFKVITTIKFFARVILLTKNQGIQPPLDVLELFGTLHWIAIARLVELWLCLVTPVHFQHFVNIIIIIIIFDNLTYQLALHCIGIDVLVNSNWHVSIFQLLVVVRSCVYAVSVLIVVAVPELLVRVDDVQYRVTNAANNNWI